jgi:crossover junction endodeoxyribonuclease RuvC
MKVLGIDGSLRCTGYGVIEAAGGRCRALAYGTVKMPKQARHSECLKAIRERIDAVLAEHRPDAASIEAGFFAKNARTAMVLGEVRGVAIACCAVAGVPVFEYSPRAAKQNATGWGAAPKEQVGKMVMSILGLAEMPPEDAADALALAHCHWQTGRGILQAEPL